MNEDLKRLLSPWAYDSESTITFSDVLHRSQIYLYVENRPYVNYVSQLGITRKIDERSEVTSSGISNMKIVSAPTDENDFRVAGIYASTDQPIIQVQSERSIFVTTDTHKITEHQVNITPVEPEGINYSEIETELIVI